jgi:hypothetical protein
MPYKSEAQRRWAHSPSGVRALGKDKVSEFDRKSKGRALPERKKPRSCKEHRAK